MSTQRLGLKEKLLLAALECSNGETNRSFTGEDLLVEAWKQDPQAWGLRGYELEHPDLEKLRKEIDSRGKSTGSHSLVNNGFLAKQEGRIYRLTSKGLAAAARLRQPGKAVDTTVQMKVGRELHSKIKTTLDSPIFRSWIKNPDQPRLFRDAGYFWGIGPGSPAGTVRKRVSEVDDVLQAAYQFLNDRGVSEIADARGKVLFDRNDLDRCIQFHRTLKERFAKELAILDPEGLGSVKDNRQLEMRST
jgi:hypothetical protein